MTEPISETGPGEKSPASAGSMRGGMTVERLTEILMAAKILLNGDIETSRQFEEPCVEEHPMDPDDHGRGNECRVLVGAGEVFCVVPPYEGKTMRDQADAIANAGWMMLELVATIEALVEQIEASNPAFEPTAARPGPSVGSKGNVGLREMDT